MISIKQTIFSLCNFYLIVIIENHHYYLKNTTAAFSNIYTKFYEPVSMKMIGVHTRGRFIYVNQIEKDRELMRKRKLKKRKTGPEKYSNKSVKCSRYRQCAKENSFSFLAKQYNIHKLQRLKIDSLHFIYFDINSRLLF